MPLVSLLLVPFVFTLGGYVFHGLLAPMSEALGVSIATAGALQSAFAVSCALAGPLLARFTQRLGRKTVLLATLAALTLLNALSAVAATFETLLALRVAIGAAGSLALPVAIAVAAMMTPHERRAGAIATVYSGVALAWMLGIPLGSVVGSAFGWPASFAMASLLCAFTFVLVLLNVPAHPPAIAAVARRRLGLGEVGLLALTFMAFASMFAMVGFIAPIITALTGLSGAAIALFQVLLGGLGLVGLRLGARLAMAEGGRGLLWPFVGMLAALAIVVPALALGVSGSVGLGAMIASALVGPVSLFAVAPVIQTRLAERAGPTATFALALNGSMVFLGQGVGVSLGAFAIGHYGLAAAPLAGAIVAALGVGLAMIMAPLTRAETAAEGARSA
ncbi:MFS transporter [Acuticoccus kandeliae]|uniref:MFS transporter n=1 Tax=Acuticoccus kandeliae TaxID=2073160 RepID=UPI000D3EB606|nr:MFS transporter [Acuticoccus kandeliae]